jgi:hypothetical protein
MRRVGKASACPPFLISIDVGASTTRRDISISHLKQLEGMRSHSRGMICPSCASEPPYRNSMRAQGRPGAGRTHGPPAAKNAGGRYHRLSRDNPAFPARWFSRLYVVSLVRRAFWPPSSARRVSVIANLTPASGCQDPTTSRPRAAIRPHAKSALRQPRGHRVPHPRLVTIAIRPSCRGGTGGVDINFGKNAIEIFLRRSWTGGSD